MTGIIPQLFTFTETPFQQVGNVLTVDLSPLKGKVPFQCALELNNGNLAIVDNSGLNYNLTLPLAGLTFPEKFVIESAVLVKATQGSSIAYVFTNCLQTLVITRNLSIQLTSLFPVGNPQAVSKIYFSSLQQQLSNI